jgi:hypothetical protein
MKNGDGYTSATFLANVGIPRRGNGNQPSPSEALGE